MQTAAIQPPTIPAGFSPAGKLAFAPHAFVPESWSPGAVKFHDRLPSMNRRSVVAGVPPAVEPGVSPGGIALDPLSVNGSCAETFVGQTLETRGAKRRWERAGVRAAHRIFRSLLSGSVAGKEVVDYDPS